MKFRNHFGWNLSVFSIVTIKRKEFGKGQMQAINSMEASR